MEPKEPDEEKTNQDWESFVAEHGDVVEPSEDIDWSEVAPDEETLEREEQKQFDSLEKNSQRWTWMKDKKHKQMSPPLGI